MTQKIATLTRVRIENYRCLREVDVPLAPLTVLIGPNDSGKSTFLGALERLGQAARSKWDGTSWLGDPSAQPSILGELSSGESRAIGGDQHVHPPPGSVLLPRAHSGPKVGGGTYFDLAPSRLPQESGGHGDKRGVPKLDEVGGGAAALLDYLLRRDRERFDAYVAAARAQIPGLKDLRIATPEPEKRRIDLVTEKGFEVPPAHQSAGVRLMLFMLALAFHPSPPGLVLIDEPENGIHPRRLKEVISLLRQLSRGEHGDHNAQVVLSTHSPYLLDHIDPEQDQVLVFRRNEEDGSRTAEPVDPERVRGFLDEFMLGEVWFNQEESALVARRTESKG
ncbi:MAG: hypothetical protein CME06_17830 [Gemmatimonadetes bacterium]|nr:hypothetical protein [Gemmatimonadota bacterium]